MILDNLLSQKFIMIKGAIVRKLISDKKSNIEQDITQIRIIYIPSFVIKNALFQKSNITVLHSPL